MRPTFRQWLVTLAAASIVAALLVWQAFDGVSEGTDAPTPTPTATARPVLSPTPSPVPSPAVGEPSSPPTAAPTPAPPVVSGFAFPIAGACLPASDNLIPGAPRDYRAGVHEGIDFYAGLACASIVKDTPVLAAKAGTVIRADFDFVEMTPEERDELLTRSQAQGYTDEAALDRFRGRQVWIDHGGSVVTRYAHLNGIASGIVGGQYVAAGQQVGFVGNSGTPEGVTDPDAEIHLHFEIRVGDTYLGAGLPLDQVRVALEQAFSP